MAYGTVAFGKRGGNKRVAWARCSLLYLVRMVVYIGGKDITDYPWEGRGKDTSRESPVRQSAALIDDMVLCYADTTPRLCNGT
jgi:hypothetical protein